MNKFCKDCKWGRPNKTTEGFWFPKRVTAWDAYSKCLRPTGEVNPVTGETTTKMAYCDIERKGWKCDVCGPEGKYWEAKD